MTAPRQPLVLHFLDRFAVWNELIGKVPERVFVPSIDSYQMGEEVEVEIRVPGLEPAMVKASVMGCRPLSGRFPSGCFVSLGPAEVDRCREVLGLGPHSQERFAGRRHVRVDCTLAAQLLVPVLAAGEVRSLSESGVSLFTAAPLAGHPEVTMVITLLDGKALQVRGKVAWSRAELQLFGLEFDGHDEKTSARLAETVLALLSAPRGPAAPSRPDVVVADDDPSIREFLGRAIGKIGLTVLTAERGDEALELIRKQRPRLAVLDVLMPGLDGVELCKVLRADVALAPMPVVLLSAMGDARLAVVANEAGASDYLSKPVALAQLRALIDKYLGGE